MNRREQLRRDMLVAVEVHSGASRREVATRHEISERTLRRAMGRVRESSGAGLPAGAASLEQLDEHCAKTSALIEDLAIARLEAKNPRTRIAAMRLQSSLMADRFELLAALGVVPSCRATRASRAAAVHDLRRRLVLAARDEGLGPEIEQWLVRVTDDLAYGA